jgi:hypothetical protein
MAEKSNQDDSAEDDQPPSATQSASNHSELVAVSDNAINSEKELSAKQLIRDVLIQLPQERLNIDGSISVLKWGSGIQSKLKFATVLDLTANPSFAQYTIFDTFGRALEQLTITRAGSSPPEFSYASGQPLVLRPTPNLSKTIRNTDITWLDLTLSFLWWKPEQHIDTDSIRSRDCYVIKVRRPADKNTDIKENITTHSAARLWIDKKAHVLMQAEAINSDDKAIRRLWVKSIKKINGRWMIKDMEVAGSSADTRTRLTVRNVKQATDYDN